MIEDQDWHPADIKCALHKKGVTLRKLSLDNGYLDRNSLSKALRRPWPKAEGIIAAALGTSPETLWPSRYDHRRPLRGIGGKPSHKPKPEYLSQPVSAT